MNPWTIRDDEILILYVRTHDALYNAKSKGYRKTQLKQKLWREIGAILSRTDSDCTKRWCYVRDYYIRRKGKPGIGSPGEAPKRRSDLLSFLDRLPSSQRNSISNVEDDKLGERSEIMENTQSNSDIQSDSQESEDVTQNDTKYVIIKQESNNGDDIDDIASKNDGNTNTDDGYIDIHIVNKDQISNKKRKNISDAQQHLSPLKEISQQKPSTQNELDEHDLFFSCMAKIVKRLPKYEQVMLRMQIGSLVNNAELQHISNNSLE